MTTNASHKSRNRRTLAQGFSATFGRIELPQAGRKSLVVLGIAGLLITGAASADWFVKDSEVIRILEDIRDNHIAKDKGTVTGHLNTVNDRLTITADEFKAGDGGADNPTLVEPKESDDKLTDKAKPTQATGTDMNSRCPAGQPQQQMICQEMYKTEIAKYRFSLQMYDVAEKRNEKLQEIVSERNGLNEKDYGKMEENTNKLVALTAQMDNDRDRYDTYINAYDARMAHLQKSSDLLANQSINGGGGGIGGVVAGAAGAALLVGALHGAAKTDRRGCTRRMQEAGVC